VRALLAAVLLAAVVVAAVALPAAAQPAAAEGAAAAVTSCTICHGDADMFGDEVVARIVGGFADDVHGSVGLSCQDCHGGNPDPALADDPDAMDPDFAANPFRGVPQRAEIPDFCGRCHSDAAFMKRFQPDARVDQETEYWTSQHGMLLRQGDDKVATCVDCHGVHGIRGPDDPRSPVHPTQVAETCGGCHASPEYMAGYTLPDGRPLPVDQLARWQRSAHAHALIDREDLFAPTCNDCHGNHGATPPGLDSISFVCGQCHGREATLFRGSRKQQGFEEHNGFGLADLGPQGCAECHEAPEPQADYASPGHFSECSTCHGNHSVVRPTVALLAPLPETPCALCHEPVGEVAAAFPEAPGTEATYRAVRDGLLARAADQDLAGDERFDWLVDRAHELPNHTVTGQGGEGAELRPEFARLFDKFRIGKTYHTYVDPATGETVRERITRCTDCHAAEPALGESDGYDTAKAYLTGMQELTVLAARAERLTLHARRGGVEVRDALLDLDHAVDAQIELEVLVHGFNAEPDGAFQKKQAEGIGFARSALEASQAALGELAYRRRGLAVALVFILLVLVGLAFKIRQIG